MTFDTIDWLPVMRVALIFGHVLAVAAACAAIAFGDYAIFARKRIDGALLRKAELAVTIALLSLWTTGLALIWIDTRFDWDLLAANPKLLAKLTIVTLLSLNGGALHYFGFPSLRMAHADSLHAARIPAMLGAISVVTWLYAAFTALAKPLEPLLGYSGFIFVYLIVVCTAIIVALVWMRPRLALRMALTALVNERNPAFVRGASKIIRVSYYGRYLPSPTASMAGFKREKLS